MDTSSANSFPLDCISIPKSHHFRAGVSMDLSEDGTKMFAFGGYEEGGNMMYILDRVNEMEKEGWEENWQKMKLKSIGRCAHSSFVKDNKLYLHGGYGASGSKTGFTAYSIMEVVDLNDFSVTTVKYNSVISNVERRWHQSFVRDNKFFIHGGWNDRGPPGLSDMIFLNLDSFEWSPIEYQGDFTPGPRRWHAMTNIEGTTKYLMSSGYSGDKKNLLRDMASFDLETQTWYPIERSNTPDARAKHNLLQIGTKEIMLIGGEDNYGNNCQDIHIFHTDDYSWRKISNNKEFFEANRGHSKAIKVSENGILIGGGYIPSYVAPFYFLDKRTLQY